MSVDEKTPGKVIRPDWDTYFIRLAHMVATRGTCMRKLVGAVIVDDHKRIVATGYNGAPRGAEHCGSDNHEIVDGHCVRTLHAESNAIDAAGPRCEGATLYATVTPCYDCAKRIANTKISRVVYAQHYESRYGKSSSVPEFLRSLGVAVEHLERSDLIPMFGSLDAPERREKVVHLRRGSLDTPERREKVVHLRRALAVVSFSDVSTNLAYGAALDELVEMALGRK